MSSSGRSSQSGPSPALRTSPTNQQSKLRLPLTGRLALKWFSRRSPGVDRTVPSGRGCQSERGVLVLLEDSPSSGRIWAYNLADLPSPEGTVRRAIAATDPSELQAARALAFARGEEPPSDSNLVRAATAAAAVVAIALALLLLFRVSRSIRR